MNCACFDDDATFVLNREGSSSLPGASRRKFLGTLAAVGAGAMLPTGELIAQASRPGVNLKTGRIDVHHHALSPNFMKASGVGASWNWTPAVSIAQMDKCGIATSFLASGNMQQGRDMARESNEYMAQIVRDYPGRFGMFTALPLPDQDGTLREIEYGYQTLKADGVAFLTSYGDKWLGDPAFEPTFQELDRRSAVAFVHVIGPSCCDHLVPGIPAAMAEYDFDTTRTIESLLVNGTFSRFPNIRFIFVHSGGTLPVLAGRINDRFPKDRADRVPDGVLPTLKRLYYEVAHATYAPPLAALTKFVPMSQILFGTDYPAEQMVSTVDPLAQFGLSAADLQAINRGNAERLFPRLKA
jgi:predicted TIM-barrel fold metal-dependent hydrolase